MKIKHIILLALRIIVGGMLAFSGVMKLMDMPMVTEYFTAMGITSAAVVWAVSVGELLAGLGILFGVYTQIAAAAAAIIMAGAVYYTSKYAGSTEVISTSVLLAGSLILVYTGSGKYAIKPCECSVKDLTSSTPAPVAQAAPSVTPPPVQPTASTNNPTL